MDFVGFSKHAEKNDPGELLEILNTFFPGFDQISKKNNVVKIKTIGDCYIAALESYTQMTMSITFVMLP